ncbi:hypothetical protein AVEN_32969-1 [Araneus ventricosus]|uniref:Uncharacterized protein n=1 Tax=Araneus ventricosus TaxID=182803 RepID=A0A4Y2INH4_ARAVE|nr:hypothetical protein AVEN_32969-1 [Araneus ventricosus]
MRSVATLFASCFSWTAIYPHVLAVRGDPLDGWYISVPGLSIGRYPSLLTGLLKGIKRKVHSLGLVLRVVNVPGGDSDRIGPGRQGIVDFTDVELQQSDVVPTEEECLGDEVLHLDTMMPELSNVPASTPAETPRPSSIKRRRQQEDPGIEEAFRILKEANKNM